MTGQQLEVVLVASIAVNVLLAITLLFVPALWRRRRAGDRPGELGRMAAAGAGGAIVLAAAAPIREGARGAADLDAGDHPSDAGELAGVEPPAHAPGGTGTAATGGGLAESAGASRAIAAQTGDRATSMDVNLASLPGPDEPTDVAAFVDAAPMLDDELASRVTSGAESSRRFPIVHHHDPHAGRTIEAFFSGLEDDEDVGGVAPAVPTWAGPSRPAADAQRGAAAGSGRDAVRASEMLIDTLTGLDAPAGWARALELEAARLSRYHRPATIVVGELDGLDRLAATFGPGAAERLLPAVADSFRREARGADRVARIGAARFAVLLPETDEVQAINYVERVRAACDRWLEAGAVALRLSLGWASPPPSGDLDTAFRLAEQRLYAERRGSVRQRRTTEPPLGRPSN